MSIRPVSAISFSEYPMAIFGVGGLVASTLLNQFVLPSLSLRFRKGRGFTLGSATDTWWP